MKLNLPPLNPVHRKKNIRWIAKINDYLDSIGGSISNYSQCIEVGSIVKRHISFRFNEELQYEFQELKNIKNQIAKLNQKISRLRGEYKKDWLAKQEKTETLDKIKKFAERLNRRHLNLIDQQHYLSFNCREITINSLSEARAFGGVDLKYAEGYKNPKAAESINNMCRYLPTSWLKSFRPIRASLAGRGFYRTETNRMSFVRTDNNVDCIALHLMSHCVESHIPKVLKLEKQFWESKRDGEFAWLGPPYRRSELGVKAKFRDRYLTKYDEAGLELLALVLPTIFHFDSFLTRRLILRDSQLINFVYGLLVGV